MIQSRFNPVSLMIQGRFQIPSPVQLQFWSVSDYDFETEQEIHVNRSTTSSCFQVLSRFVHKMGNGKVSIFFPFKKTIRQVLLDLGLIDVDIKIDPTIRLTPFNIINLPNDLQPTALAFIELIEGTITAIAELTATTEELTASNINVLQQKGFVGKKDNIGQSIYFILT